MQSEGFSSKYLQHKASNAAYKHRYADILTSYSNIVNSTLTVAVSLGEYISPVFRWLEHPELTGGDRFTYIDIFHGGKHITTQQAKALLSPELHNSQAEDHINNKVFYFA